MKRLLTTVAVCLIAFVPMYAQHGRGNAGGQSMGHSKIGQTSSTHGKAATPDTGKKAPGDLLMQNQKLSDKLQKLLPSGMTPQDACSGFRNLGQCVAAVHVSNNLGLSFTDLKAKMLGPSDQTAGSPTQQMSLGKAIQALAPKADATAEVNKANKQAKDDLSGTA